MAKKTKNPLESLSLSGLENAKEQVIHATKGKAQKATGAIESLVDLGPLSLLPGTWEGTGFNLIEIPNMNQAKPGPPPADKFKLMLNNTFETLTFSLIDGGIINRGNAQGDIEYFGLHYLQQVIDVNLKQGENGIHLETGLFINLPATTQPLADKSVARLGSIPHGDSLLAQGSFLVVDGPPLFDVPVADPTPFTIVNGKRKNDTSDAYLSLLRNAVPPNGIPKAAIMDPNLMLRNAVQGQNITRTTVIFLDANPVNGVANPNALPNAGGITNIPFINVNANATSLTAIFWIEEGTDVDGSELLQLQYTQTVILDFPVFGAPPANEVVPIKWPHISVATLRKKKS